MWAPTPAIAQSHHRPQSHKHSTLAAYMRELMQAIGHLDFEVTGSRITVRDGAREVTIDLVYEGNCHLGSRDLPMTQVDFEFNGYIEEEMSSFMDRLSLHTLRHGG